MAAYGMLSANAYTLALGVVRTCMATVHYMAMHKPMSLTPHVIRHDGVLSSSSASKCSTDAMVSTLTPDDQAGPACHLCAHTPVHVVCACMAVLVRCSSSRYTLPCLQRPACADMLCQSPTPNPLPDPSPRNSSRGPGAPGGRGPRLDLRVLQRALLHDLARTQLVAPVDDVHLAAVLGQEARLLHRRVAAADDRQRLAPEHGRGAVAHRARADPLVPEAVDLARAREVQPPRDRACAQDAQFRYQSPPVAFIRTQALHSASPQSLHFGEPCTSSGRGRCCTPGLCTTAYAQHSRHCHGKHALVYSLPFRNC